MLSNEEPPPVAPDGGPSRVRDYARRVVVLRLSDCRTVRLRTTRTFRLTIRRIDLLIILRNDDIEPSFRKQGDTRTVGPDRPTSPRAKVGCRLICGLLTHLPAFYHDQRRCVKSPLPSGVSQIFCENRLTSGGFSLVIEAAPLDGQ